MRQLERGFAMQLSTNLKSLPMPGAVCKVKRFFAKDPPTENSRKFDRNKLQIPSQLNRYLAFHVSRRILGMVKYRDMVFLGSDESAMPSISLFHRAMRVTTKGNQQYSLSGFKTHAATIFGN
jgi:hypothetical protein